MVELSLSMIGWLITIAIAIVGILMSIIGKLKSEVSQKKKEQFDELKNAIRELVDKFEKMTVNMQAQNEKILQTFNKYDLLSKFIDDHADEIHNLGEKISDLDKDIQSIKFNFATNNHRKHIKE